MAATVAPRVLVVEDDLEVSEMIRATLLHEGYLVSGLTTHGLPELQGEVAARPPDCVLLDGAGLSSYAGSWELAAWLSTRTPPVPVVMLTAHSVDAEEARQAKSERAIAAHFAAVVPKPFDLDELLAVIARVTGRG